MARKKSQRKRDYQVKKQFWLSLEDNALLIEKSQRACISQVALVRLLLRGYEPREKPGEEFYRVMDGLYALSASLERLIAIAECDDELSRMGSGAFVDMLDRELKRLHKFQEDVEERFLGNERAV